MALFQDPCLSFQHLFFRDWQFESLYNFDGDRKLTFFINSLENTWKITSSYSFLFVVKVINRCWLKINKLFGPFFIYLFWFEVILFGGIDAISVSENNSIVMFFIDLLLYCVESESFKVDDIFWYFFAFGRHDEYCFLDKFEEDWTFFTSEYLFSIGLNPR